MGIGSIGKAHDTEVIRLWSINFVYILSMSQQKWPIFNHWTIGQLILPLKHNCYVIIKKMFIIHNDIIIL